MKRSPLTRRTRLKPVSAKRRAQFEGRATCREIVLERDGHLCQARLPGCWVTATDVHEVLSRGRGGSITDPENCLALCRPCHKFITENPMWSKDQGFAVSAQPRLSVLASDQPQGGTMESLFDVPALRVVADTERMDEARRHAAPFVSGSVTSLDAARKITPKAGTLRQLVLDLLSEEPMTDEQGSLISGLNPSTYRPRRVELVKAGLVVEVGRSKTASGREAVVWGPSDTGGR